MGPLDLLWLFFIFPTFHPLVQQKVPLSRSPRHWPAMPGQ
jgi:hypothetical protein